MRVEKIICLLAILAISSGSVFANDWAGVSGANWNVDSNWSLGHRPTAGEWATLAYAGIDATIDTPGTCLGIEIGNNWNAELAAATLYVNEGANLNVVTSSMRVGWSSPGAVVQSGGLVQISNIGQWLDFAIGNFAHASYTMTGGVARTSAGSGIIVNSKAKSFSQGPCILDVQGGSMYGDYFELVQGGGGAMGNIGATGHLFIKGDITGAIDDMVDDGVLVGCYGAGTVYSNYNEATDVTHVWAPEPMTVVLLGLGGLLLRKKH